MASTVRTLISVGFVGVCLWGAFAVPLGDKTLADHVDAIGDTPEASQLMDGARDTINPALDEVKDRILGENVAAPTHLSSDPAAGDLPPSDLADDQPPPPTPTIDAETSDDDEPSGIYASDVSAPRPLPSGRPSTGDRVRLPGQAD